MHGYWKSCKHIFEIWCNGNLGQSSQQTEEGQPSGLIIQLVAESRGGSRGDQSDHATMVKIGQKNRKLLN
jgi:hypothetical protein